MEPLNLDNLLWSRPKERIKFKSRPINIKDLKIYSKALQSRVIKRKVTKKGSPIRVLQTRKIQKIRRIKQNTSVDSQFLEQKILLVYKSQRKQEASLRQPYLKLTLCREICKELSKIWIQMECQIRPKTSLLILETSRNRSISRPPSQKVKMYSLLSIKIWKTVVMARRKSKVSSVNPRLSLKVVSMKQLILPKFKARLQLGVEVQVNLKRRLFKIRARQGWIRKVLIIIQQQPIRQCLIISVNQRSVTIIWIIINWFRTQVTTTSPH